MSLVVVVEKYLCGSSLAATAPLLKITPLCFGGMGWISLRFRSGESLCCCAIIYYSHIAAHSSVHPTLSSHSLLQILPKSCDLHLNT